MSHTDASNEPSGPSLVRACVDLGLTLRQAMADALLPYGVTPEQHEVLALIAAGKSSPRELVDACGRDKTTLSRVIARATRAGLIAPTRLEHDRRRQVLRLTERGATTVEQTSRMLERAAPKLLASLSPKERRRLRKISKKLHTALVEG